MRIAGVAQVSTCCVADFGNKNISEGSRISGGDFRTFIETRPPEIVANILICLIHQANYPLDRQFRRLEQDFLKEGGLRERMTRARLAARARQSRVFLSLLGLPSSAVGTPRGLCRC
jgi:four helix bundle suffix protein